MKSQFARIKNRARSVSARTLALVLCFVMLVTAVSAGAVIDSSNAVNGYSNAGSAVADGIDQIADIADDDAAETAKEPSGDGSLIKKMTSSIQNAASTAADIEENIPTRRKSDLAETGRKSDLATTGANSYNLETGARYYLNTYVADGLPFSDSATKAYVYCAFIWNDYKNYSIIKMDKIANSDWYTCETANGNIVDGNTTRRRGDMDGVCFFTSDSSSWATKSKYFSNKGAFSDIQNNAKVLDCYASSLDGRNAYNGHSYYYSVTGLTKDYDNKTLANSASETKTSWQKATVYSSTDGSTYNVAAAGDGGEVQIGSYYWATAYTTSDKGFSDASDDFTRYSQYNNAVVTSWVTLKVTDTYDGWHFMGWYDSSGNPAGTNPTSLTNYYQITSTSTFDVHARFLKPEYTSVTPKAASTVDSGTMLFKKNDTTPKAIYFWNYGDNWGGNSKPALTQIGSTNIYKYTASELADDQINPNYPKAKVYSKTWGEASSNWNTWNSNALSGDITDAGTVPDSRIWYFALKSDKSGGNWTNFVHLGVTGLSVDKTTAEIGEEVTLTATAPSTGTFNSGAKYNYYYSTNASDANPTWYKIAEDSSSTTQKFYPPSNGFYTYKVAVVDGEGVETVVATSATTTTVGVVGGKYLAGSKTLFGGADNWDTALDKGLMTETPASSGIYKLTFGNVAAGTYQFRVTTLNADGTVTWETDSGDAISGTASPIHAGESDNNIQFTLSEKKQVTITYIDSTKAVTVDVADVQAVDVVVYCGAGGMVEVTYGTAVTEIPENENATIKVAYGDSIDLEATGIGASFSKWYKNLVVNYKGTPAKENGYDSLEHEVITQRTVYVAEFSGGSGSWLYSADSSAASPEISGDASSYHMLFSTDKAKLGQAPSDENDTTKGNVATYKSGSEYWSDLTSVFSNNSNTSGLNIALSDNTSNSGIRGDKSNMKINGTSYGQGNGPTFKNSNDETLFATRFQEHNNVSGTVYFIEIYDADWTKISALGVRAVYTGSGGVNYKFYYKLAGAGAASSTYVPSTNFYAKDASVRNVTGESVNGLQYNFWIFPTRTEVEAVDGQVDVQKDHEANASAIGGHNQWVEGFALKGSQITVSTIIPHRGSYNVTDSNGTTTTVNADDKYYVKGFSFNGVTPKLLSATDGVSIASFTTYNTDGTPWTGSGTKYTCTYTIPADMKEAKMEITPILFVKDAYASNTVMVYINGYNDNVKNAGWGNTLYVYPFYQYYQNGSGDPKSTYYGQGENFGRYPGQPVINYGGQLFMQIPLTDDASARGKNNNGGPIKGITINNGYYDYVHKDCCNHVSIHRQTYDYDDFAKIYNNKKTKNSEKYLYSIYFSFKYFPENSSKQHRKSTTTSTITGDGNASRYNDLLADGNILSDTTGTVAAATLITAGDNSTGWEYLTDALGNNVDIFGNKITNPSAEPLRIFSLGYEFNNAGKWATEWAVYRLNGANYELIYDDAWGIDSSSGHNNKYYNSSIVPSALLYNDKASLAAATSLDGDQPIRGYAGLYENLEDYRGVPVMICYEHDIPDAFSPKNYRCDGRWTFTTVDDFVRSNIKIQYYDKDGILHDDTYADDSSVVGETTGCSAYFTNSEYYGKRVSDSEIIDNSKSYTFQAENKGTYEFDGWYMYDTAGHESTIVKGSLTANTPRSGNFVLAARFRYVAEGSLTISSSMATGSIGRGTAYIGVTAINGDKETILANVNSNTAPVTVDKSYITSSSRYDIRIEIRTVPEGENQYASYNCYVTDENDNRAAESRTYDADPTFDSQQSFYNSSDNISTATRTYTLNVKKDIFNSSTTQEIKAIEYETTMTPVHYTYSVKFNYTSRQYGNQAFTRTGELTSGQINDTNVVTGTLNKTDEPDKKLTKAFLAKIAPHESNFNKKISWNFDAVVNSQTCTYDGNSNTYAISLTIENNQQVETTDVARHGYFTVPYAQTNGVATSVEGKVAKVTPTNFTIDVDYNGFFYTSGTSTFVTAPTVIYETVDGAEKERRFKYWKIETVTSKRGNARLIGKCYFPEFNYRALDNYNITAVYTTSDEDTANYADLYASEAGTTSIAFIGNSRNQWNNNNRGSHGYYAGDLIYNDFILSFKPQDNKLFKDLDTAECGVIIQRLKQIETNSSGVNSKTLQEYAADYSADDLAAAKTAAATKAGDGTAAGYTQIKVACNKSDVNDKNRYHFVYSMFNSAKKTNEAAVQNTNNCKYLYRAYSYMKIGDGSYVLSDDPA